MKQSSCFDLQETIIEGFICPSCLKSFGRPELLEDHFAKHHVYATPIETIQTFNAVKFPTLGTIRQLTSEFKRLRKAQVNKTALETNLLLVRLEKWLNLPDNVDKPQRHFLEQTIVPWIEADINLCPRCGARFGLSWPIEGEEGGSLAKERPARTPGSLLVSPSSAASSLTNRARQGLRSVTSLATALLDGNPTYRRMHHCRLCGHIICADCSCFLTKEEVIRVVAACNWTTAKSLKSAVLPEDGIFSVEEKDGNLFKRSISFLKMSSGQENGSPDSSPVPGKKMPLNLRLCEVCRSLLELKMFQIDERNTIPANIEKFEELKQEMERVNQKMPLFSSMASSLISGEEKYILEIAKNLRHEILQSLQKIDVIGKEIDSLEKADSLVPAASARISSQKRINQTVVRFARRFVQTNLPPLRVLPSEDEHRELARRRTSQLTAPQMLLQQQAFAAKMGIGWIPSMSSLQSLEDPILPEGKPDPRAILMRQIDTVADYLVQAKTANRSEDEIRSLSNNLADLEAELTRLSAQNN